MKPRTIFCAGMAVEGGVRYSTNVMPTKVGTHDKFQRDGICCGFAMRRGVLWLGVAVDPGLRRDDGG